MKTRKKKRGIENGRRARKVVDWNTSNLNTCPFWFWSSKNERHEYLWWYRSLISKACDGMNGKIHIYIYIYIYMLPVNQKLLFFFPVFFFFFFLPFKSIKVLLNYETTSSVQFYCLTVFSRGLLLFKYSHSLKKNKILWLYCSTMCWRGLLSFIKKKFVALLLHHVLYVVYLLLIKYSHSFKK